jgi:hypothetical protein
VDIAAWLSSLGLERYKQAFEDNAVDFGVLPGLTADDLKDLGITAVGHRRKLLQAIAVLAEVSRSHGPAPPQSARGSRPAFRARTGPSLEPGALHPRHPDDPRGWGWDTTEEILSHSAGHK